MVVLSRTCREVFVVNDFYACFHMVATVVTLSQVNFVPRSYKHPAAVVKRQTQFPQRGPSPPPPPHLIVAKLLPRCRFSVPLKHNRHDTFLACRNCRQDRTRVYLDDTVATVVNCCQRVATRLFFMFPFGREHYSDDSYDRMETIWKP